MRIRVTDGPLWGRSNIIDSDDFTAGQGYRRTLVGSKRRGDFVPDPLGIELQTDPCGVEAVTVSTSRMDACYRRTLVGSKLEQATASSR